MCSVFLLGGVAVLMAGRAVASAALAFPAALPGDPHHRQCEQDSQHQQGDDTACSYHKKDLSFERIPTPVYTICPRRATGKRCRLKLFSKNENLGLHLDQRSGIISTFRFGGLAQLVRAPASHAGGLGFESLILHHTVRTRTRFFTRKGSGTFFVYRRFAFVTATNTPVGCLSNRTVCVSRWRGFAPTSSATRVRRAVNKQRQGIIVAVVSCLCSFQNQTDYRCKQFVE